jgi:hypothetical protein
MAEIKLSDGTLIKTLKTVSELQAQLIPAENRFVRIEDRDGNEYNVNREQIVFMRDNK